MRVRLPRRDIGDEKGATIVIVALSLVLIFTLVSLAVDVGFSLVRHRGLVNAADAAALAAAESLATNDTTDISCDFGTTIAEHQACSLAKANDADAQPDGANWFVLEPGIPGIVCTNCGRVTVKLQAPQQQFFAPIFGGSSSEIVHTEATAIYGPAISSLVPPIMVEPRLGWDPDHLVTCDFTTLVVGEKCNFWFDSNSIGNSSWGLLSLDQWNVAGDANCNSSGGASSLSGYITNGKFVGLSPNPSGLFPPPPTYVCVMSGAKTSDWQKALQDQAAVKATRVFPVNLCTADGSAGQVDKNGHVVPCLTNPDKYDIIEFIPLEIDGLLDGQAANGTPALGNNCKQNHDFASPTDSYDLVLSGCSTVNMTTPQLFTGNGKNQIPVPECQASPPNPDPCFTQSGTQITWYGTTPEKKNQNTTSVEIDWSWSTPGLPGPCGPFHPNASNAFCMETTYQGPVITGGEVGSGPDTGAMATRLYK